MTTKRKLEIVEVNMESTVEEQELQAQMEKEMALEM